MYRATGKTGRASTEQTVSCNQNIYNFDQHAEWFTYSFRLFVNLSKRTLVKHVISRYVKLLIDHFEVLRLNIGPRKRGDDIPEVITYS